MAFAVSVSTRRIRVPVTTTSCRVVSAASGLGPAFAASANGANPTVAAAAPAVPTANPTACLIVKLLDIFGAPCHVQNSRNSMRLPVTGIATRPQSTLCLLKKFSPQTLNVALLRQVQLM
jgi:hypothetical protein